MHWPIHASINSIIHWSIRSPICLFSDVGLWGGFTRHGGAPSALRYQDIAGIGVLGGLGASSDSVQGQRGVRVSVHLLEQLEEYVEQAFRRCASAVHVGWHRQVEGLSRSDEFAVACGLELEEAAEAERRAREIRPNTRRWGSMRDWRLCMCEKNTKVWLCDLRRLPIWLHRAERCDWWLNGSKQKWFCCCVCHVRS